MAEVLGFLQSGFKRERERERACCTSPTSETLRSGKRNAHTSNEIKGSPFGSLFLLCCLVLSFYLFLLFFQPSGSGCDSI